MTTVFLIVGGTGLLLLAASLVSGLHLHIGHLHAHLPGHATGHHPAADAALSLPSVAGFIGAFGFGGAIASVLLAPGSAGLPCLIGLAAAVPTSWFAARLTRAAMLMPTDATPAQSDVIGALGVVVRAIPGQGYGEVRVAFAGQQMRFHARAEHPLPAGTPVLVVDAPSTTSVVVEATTPVLG